MAQALTSWRVSLSNRSPSAGSDEENGLKDAIPLDSRTE